MADKVAGLTALYATMMALFHRERTGEGQEVEVGMFETMASFMLVEHANGAMFDPPLGPALYPRAVAPNRRPYRTSDGYIAALIYNDKHWTAFIDAVRPPWASDPYATLEQRARQIDTVYALLAETLVQRTTQEWLELVPRTGNTRRGAVQSGELVRRRAPERGRLFRDGATPRTARCAFPGCRPGFPAPRVASPAPRRSCGADTAQVLEELGLALVDSEADANRPVRYSDRAEYRKTEAVPSRVLDDDPAAAHLGLL